MDVFKGAGSAQTRRIAKHFNRLASPYLALPRLTLRLRGDEGRCSIAQNAHITIASYRQWYSNNTVTTVVECHARPVQPLLAPYGSTITAW